MMLTLRAKSSEIAVLREVLCRHQAEALAAAVAAPRIPSPTVGAADVEDAYDEMFVIAKLLEELRRPAPAGQPRELIGPTRLLDPVIREAAAEAAQRLSDAVDVFRADTGRLTADELRAALDTASACTTTLIGLDYAQNHAVQ